jgi:hypothetical protein
MRFAMEKQSVRAHRILVTHAPQDALAPITRLILGRLGYAILTPQEFEEVSHTLERPRPDLRIVDERSLAELPEDESPPVPTIVLTGRHGATGADSRVVGAVKRPAGLHELFRLLQQVLEEVPRSTPRVPTHLAARLSHDGREWRGAVLSLSENGCLLRSPEPLLLGERLDIAFDLPRTGTVQLTTEVAYQLVPDAGLIFLRTAPSDRQAISSFVTSTLLSSAAAAA